MFDAPVLKTDPDELLMFESGEAQLKLSNLTNRNVYFKIRTTVPLLYSVYPTIGTINAYNSSQLKISMQKPDEATDTIFSKHKFQVQSAYINNENVLAEDYWKNCGSDHLWKKQLKVGLRRPGQHATEYYNLEQRHSEQYPIERRLHEQIAQYKLEQVPAEQPSVEQDSVEQRPVEENSMELHEYDHRSEGGSTACRSVDASTRTVSRFDTGRLSMIGIIFLVLGAFLLGVIIGGLL